MYSPIYGTTETNGIELDSIKLCNVIFSNNKVYVIPKPKLKNRCEREGERDREINAERQTELIASAEQSYAVIFPCMLEIIINKNCSQSDVK